jgi:hypothetical protein
LPHWHPEPATDGQGSWLVRVDASRISVIAPPAVALGRRAEPPRREAHLPGGWRLAVWAHHPDQELSIDEDPPATVREVDTATVLILIDTELHEFVWSCLWAQLQIARQVGRRRLGKVPSEDPARAGALSAAWIQHELTRAFPSRAHLLEPNVTDDSCDFPDDPIDLIPLCQDTPWASEGAPLRHLARWFTYKVNPSESGCLNHKHLWHISEPLGCTCKSLSDSGDRSEFDWGDISPDGNIDSLTEEMLLP